MIENRKALIKGAICGILSACCIYSSIAYFNVLPDKLQIVNGNLILYGMAAISGLITFLFLVAIQRRHFWYALGTYIILFIIMTIILDRAVWSLYFKVNPGYEEAGLGEGLAVVVIFALSLIGNAMGVISAFVATYIKA